MSNTKSLFKMYLILLTSLFTALISINVDLIKDKNNIKKMMKKSGNAGCMIVNKNNQVLLIKQSQKKIYGKLSYPAGTHEPGENPIQTAIRETKEESGVDVKVTKLIHFNDQKNKYTNKTRNFYLFECQIQNDKEINLDYKDQNKEILSVAWYNIEDLKPSDFRFEDQFFLTKQYLKSNANKQNK